MKNIPYILTIQSLIYAHICTRLVIAYVMGMLGRYQTSPGIDHRGVVNKVMVYFVFKIILFTVIYSYIYAHTSLFEKQYHPCMTGNKHMVYSISK